MASSTTEIADAATGSSFWICDKDVDRRDFRLHRDVARDQHDRAELADRAGEAQAGAGEDRGQQRRQDDPSQDRERHAPSDAAASSMSAVELEQHGLHGADDERQRDEQQREQDRELRVGEVEAERALGPVQRQQRQARPRSSAGRRAGR